MQSSEYLLYGMSAIEYVSRQEQQKSISHHDGHSWNAEINKTAHYQQLQIHKCALSHCDTKGQGSIEVIKIIVGFVNLVVGGKAKKKKKLGWGNRNNCITVYLACHIKM